MGAETDVGEAQRCAETRPPARLGRKAAVWCFGLGLVMFAAHALWPALIGRPAPIMPPAGEFFEGEAPFTFAVLSDSTGHLAQFEEILARIKAHDVKFILHGGDIVQRHDRRQYDYVLRALHRAELTVPFCVSPGNHDIDREATGPAARYKHYWAAFGPQRYWFSYANTLIVVFDNASERCGPDDLAWLDR